MSFQAAAENHWEQILAGGDHEVVGTDGKGSKNEASETPLLLNDSFRNMQYVSLSLQCIPSSLNHM